MLIDLRWDLVFCYLMISEFLENVCKNNYNLMVIKVFIFCVFGNNIKIILDMCNLLEDVYCKVVFFVWDLRVVILLLCLIGFIKDYRDDVLKNSMRVYSYY